MACGCGDRCTCSVVAGANVTVTGSGDSITPFVISSAEATFAATTTDNSITVVPAGPSGHTPDISVEVSTDSGNLLSKHPNGLYVDPAAAVAVTRIIGELVEVTGTSTPALCLEADGHEELVASYPLLAAEYLTDGSGNNIWGTATIGGAGWFVVPDLRKRQTIGSVGAGPANIGTTDAIAFGSRTNIHNHGIPAESVTSTISGTAAGTTGTHAFTSETGVGAGGTQAEWNKVGATTDNNVNQANATRDSIEDIVNFNTGTTVAITAVDVVSFTNSTHDHPVSIPVTGSASGSTAGGTSDPTTIPFAVVRKVVFAGA